MLAFAPILVCCAEFFGGEAPEEGGEDKEGGVGFPKPTWKDLLEGDNCT